MFWLVIMVLLFGNIWLMLLCGRVLWVRVGCGFFVILLSMVCMLGLKGMGMVMVFFGWDGVRGFWG